MTRDPGFPAGPQRRISNFPSPSGEDVPITRERYISPEFMQLELDYFWPRIWNVGGRRSELSEPGDFITHQLGGDSILMVQQDDGSVRAFHNVCPHRGNRLVHPESGGVDSFVCGYHGWTFSRDGTLVEVQDPEDFAKGNPCGKLNLKEINCEVWAGFIWYNMDPDCPSLADWLGEVKEYLDGYDIDKMTRTFHRVMEVEFNWKCLHDNFCESYHLPTAHPQLSSLFDDDYKNTDFLLFDSGHNLMKMKGALPSQRDDDPNAVGPALAAEMEAWGLDPADFEGRAQDVRAALQKQMRKLGPERGFHYFDKLEDAQLTDRFHFNLLGGTTMTMSPISLNMQRAEPHPSDPNKAIYEYWNLTAGPITKSGEVPSPVGMIPFREAEKEVVKYGEGSVGFVADQDIQVATGQQQGFHSRGFKGAYLAGQEHRIQQFHNAIDRYIREGIEAERGLRSA